MSTEIETPIQTTATVCDEAITDCLDHLDAYKSNLKWLNDNREWINEVGLKPSFSGTSTFFHNPKHDQVISIIRGIGGKFQKSYNATSITYKNLSGDRWFYLADSQPPGTCRMVPVIETVPSHWEPEKVVKTFKLQCKEEGEGETADVELPQEPFDFYQQENSVTAELQAEAKTKAPAPTGE